MSREQPRRAAIAAGIVPLMWIGLGCTRPDPTSKEQGTPENAESRPMPGAPAGDAEPWIAEAASVVARAAAPATTWDGPTSGPKAQAGELIVYVSSDQRNGGAAAVAQGAAEAARAIGWEIRTLDGQGTPLSTSAALNQAIALKPVGIILGGFDAAEQKEAVGRARAEGIHVVGWHAAPSIGPLSDPQVFANITTDAAEVARVAADHVIVSSRGAAGVVIFTDSHFSIAVTKAEVMRDEVKRCKRCRVLSYEDSPLGEASTRTPQLMNALLQRFGPTWTHALGINDLYFDFGSPALRAAGVPPSGPPLAVSAGDGSESAFARIRAGEYQLATVAEPLNLQGWQAVDELNRAMAGAPWSGYVIPVHLVTRDNLGGGAGNVYDPPNGYRDEYRKIWGGR
jgi:ribose transport system substrate-binding protein